MFRNPEFRPGETRPGAHELNDLFDELERLGRIAVLAPLVMVDSEAGIQFGIHLEESMWIKLTGGGAGGKYDWTEQIATSGGGWTAGYHSGTTTTDPAFEINGNASVNLSPNPIVRARRDPTSLALLFQGGTC